jgi:UDP-N-acetylglucosamine 2-epimerase (non-hydrolysing)
MKILSVVGARPQFVKLAPIDRAAKVAGVEHVIVHTGQHYDPLLSDIFFRDLGISNPKVHLGVGSGSHGEQTAAMLTTLEETFAYQKPDWVLVYGDTNSTLAAAITAVKLHIPLAHLEAGLRSFNRKMPEEHNRVLTDHAADLLLAPTQVAVNHLAAEGLSGRTLLVGDVMTDILMDVAARSAGLSDRLLHQLGLEPGEFFLSTLHRAENTDDETRLRMILQSLAQLNKPVLLLAHPRVAVRAKNYKRPLNAGSLISNEPVPYPELISLAKESAGIITDSGGLQKEAFMLRVPCTTVRTETEWVETIDLGWNQLANSTAEILTATNRSLPQPTDAKPYGDGNSAQRVIEALQQKMCM